MIKILIIVAFISATTAVTPPIYNYSFHTTFDEVYNINSTAYRGNGQIFYDPKNNRQRFDRNNGRFNAFCGSVLPNVSTPCQSIIVDSKRWIIYPQRSQCCFCCDSAHGCGILKPDFLADSVYIG